jgi:hypothetical protein
MGYLPALGGKAAHLVSDLATVILNPVSERERQRHHPSHLPVSSSLPRHLLSIYDPIPASLALQDYYWSAPENPVPFPGRCLDSIDC